MILVIFNNYNELCPFFNGTSVYIEGIKNARRFMSGLRAAARLKPVIALKAGRFRSGSEAAVSHTGALVGSDDAFDAALKRAGVVRVETTAQLFAAAETLSAGRSIRGDRIAILTNGGGLGVLAADAANQLHIPLATLAPESMQRLDEVLPPAWSHANPVDILGDASRERYQLALKTCLEDKGVDGVLVMLAPQAMTKPREVAQTVVKAYRSTKKPLIACWMGGEQTQKARDLFNHERVPCVDSPMTAMESFSYLIAHHNNQRVSLEVPGPLHDPAAPDISGARMICAGVMEGRRQVLTMVESKALLAAFRIPVTPAVLVRSTHEALVSAEEMGFPVALKIHSESLTHKSDIQGVRLNIQDAQSLLIAYQEILDRASSAGIKEQVAGMTLEPMIARPHTRELMVGVKRDPVFGPVITFGLGGTLVELLKDARVVLPPLNERIIQRALVGTRTARILGQFRNLPESDVDSFIRVLHLVSEMVAELPWISEMDLNPVLVDEGGAVVADARTLISPPGPLDEPYSHLAIHPYPAHLKRIWQLPDGREITIRPIRPEDAEIEDEFVSKLSERSKYFRFMGTLNELSPTMLVRFTQIDYDLEMAFIATIPKGPREEEIAVGRYVSYPDGKTCEFAIVVADEWQGKGLGRQIMVELIRTARSKGLREMRADILKNNESMVGLARRLGFAVKTHPQDASIVVAVKDLTSTRD